MKISKYLYLLSLFIILQAVAGYFIYQNSQSKIDTLLSNESTKLQSQYQSLFATSEDLANTVFNGYINKPEIIDLFDKRDRKTLYEKLKPCYGYLTTINFNQIHFHTPDNHSFLRMHKPEKFGDDLSRYRYSVSYVNETKKSISGLEIGRIVPGFRFVYPLFNKENKHIGSVEASFDIKTFTQKLKNLYGVHTNFIINKGILEKKLFSGSRVYYDQSVESDDYIYLKDGIDDKINKNYEKIKREFKKNIDEKIKDKINEQKLFSVDAKINGNHKIITFLPVNNIENHHVGFFVVYRDSQKIEDIHTGVIYQNIIVFVIVISLFIAYAREVNFKESLKIEVDLKTKKLQNLTVELEEQTQELEELNQSLETRITVEVEKNAKQERELFQQSKQAALGDMIGNIAHQWRQPLSAISTSASGMQVTHSVGVLSDEDFISYTDAIIDNAKYLSRTIDDFRDFIKSDKVVTQFDLSRCITKCLAIVNSSINNHNLDIRTDLKDGIVVTNYENELQQAIINIFSNAKDALKTNVANSDDRLIKIVTYEDGNEIYIEISDTAGGIPQEYMDKIFEPYFTTKHQSQGTGLGLYMTHRIVVESMKGSIGVENIETTFNNHTLKGAKFTIALKK